MKLIKIGSSHSCDIVLNSEYVSAYHAEITIYDDGKLVLVDNNSRNGTYLGSKRKPIEPKKEYTIQRGDKVRFADQELVWARVPQPEKLNQYKKVYNIGSHVKNDIIINSLIVSRFHASLRIDKNGKAYIHDNNSKNGIEVNGVKIQPNTDVRIKKGDNVVCGDEDITEYIKNLIPSNNVKKIALSSLVGVAALALIAFGVYKFWPQGKFDLEKGRKSVVYIIAGYHYEISLEDDPLGLNLKMRYPIENDSLLYSQATAFFVDREGRLGTNRHVALPWEYRTADEEEVMKQRFEEFIASQLKVDIVNIDDAQSAILAWNRLNQTPLGKKLLNDCKNIDELNARIQRYKKSNLKIEGKMDFMNVGYAGRNYTHSDEFERCSVVEAAESKDEDVAILQLNKKATPVDVDQIFDITKANSDEKIAPLKDKLYTIGYPNGISWALDNKTQSLEPNLWESKCSKVPSKYYFEFQDSSLPGCSGSPVFKEDGTLVGVVFAGHIISTTAAIHIKYLKKLYEDI